MTYDCITEEILNSWFEWFLGHMEMFSALIGGVFVLVTAEVFIFVILWHFGEDFIISLFKPKKDDFIEYCFKKDGVPLASDVEDYFIEYCRFSDEVKRVRKFYSKRKNYKKYIIDGDIK